jgi:NAD(P) transhydrogenase subunit alpha
MDPNPYAGQAARIADQAAQLAEALRDNAMTGVAGLDHAAAQSEPFIALFAVFLMACFVGYYVVWNVTPALHSPLMAVTNAISSVIVVGAMLATGFAFNGVSMAFGFLAVLLASVNIFGGFLVTQRMLSMFQARKK